ncbi:hypothetical protein MHYP_G00084440 [Metynnis hypsauchen]
MSRGKEIVAIALVLIGWIIAVVACVLPMWKVSAVTEAGNGRAPVWEGLWMSCVKSSEKMQCTAYNSTQIITSDLQAARDMTVITIITALLPLTLSFMGAKCTNYIKDKALQAKVLIISGFFFIIAGCLVIIPVYWIKKSIVQEKTPSVSLYFSFAAAALLITGGVLLCCTCSPWNVRARASTSSHLPKILKIGGLALGLIGWILAIVTCALPMWVVASQTYFEGLWMSCVMQNGQLKCKLVQSSGLQNARNITLASIGLVLQALINFIRNTRGYIHVVLCIKVKASKANVIIVSGVLFIIAGIVLVIPVSLTSYNIIQGSYKSSQNTAENLGHSELGAALYTGFAAAALLIIGGVLQCCTCLTWERK